jgi:tetratricopeptide (TPR) repeat protein
MRVCSLPLRTFYLLSMVFALIFRFVAAAEIPTAHQQALRNYQFYNNLAAESESKGDWNKALKAYEQALWNAQSASLSPEIQSDLNQKIERLRKLRSSGPLFTVCSCSLTSHPYLALGCSFRSTR